MRKCVLLYPEKYETGSGGFVWKNISPIPWISDLRLHLHYAHFMQTDQSWSGNHFINHYNRIYFVVKGQAELSFNDETLLMEPGYLYLIPPYSLNSHACSGQLEFYWLHFHALVNGDLDLFSIFAQPKKIKVEQPNTVISYFKEIITSVHKESDSATGIIRRNALLSQLMIPFVEQMSKYASGQDPLAYNQLLPILKSIQDKLSEPLKVKDLADQANMTPEHFSRRFKSQFNISPKRYILLKRIDLAKQFLLLSRLSVSQIATKTGFPEVYHFSKVFKQEVGLSPLNYQKHYRE